MGFVVLVMCLIIVGLLRTRIPPRKSGPLVEWAALKEPAYMLFTFGIFLLYWTLYFAFFYVSRMPFNSATPISRLPVAEQSLNCITDPSLCSRKATLVSVGGSKSDHCHQRRRYAHTGSLRLPRRPLRGSAQLPDSLGGALWHLDVLLGGSAQRRRTLHLCRLLWPRVSRCNGSICRHGPVSDKGLGQDWHSSRHGAYHDEPWTADRPFCSRRVDCADWREISRRAGLGRRITGGRCFGFGRRTGRSVRMAFTCQDVSSCASFL